MTSSRILELGIVVALFLSYLGLWRVRRRLVSRRTGVDPEVLRQATTPVQRYFAWLVRFMTALVVSIVGLHAFASDAWPPLIHVAALDSWWFDLAGAGLGLLGLVVCALAQAAMGASWRVGIDNARRTELVTRGIFARIRNPTYAGLHLVNVGLWLIWPTTLVGAYAVLFFIVMDVQVRAEEEHLGKLHGETYWAYVARTRRYLAWIY